MKPLSPMGSSFFTGKKVVVTGGTGFVGSRLVERLVQEGAEVIVPYRNKEKAEKNLRTVLKKVVLVQGDIKDPDFCEELIKNKKMVFHLAAEVGGIQYNIKHPATIFRENLSSFMNILDAARKNNVERFLTVSSTCVYPRNCTIPTPEAEGFRDVPEETNEGYGWAKRMEEFLSKAYVKEFGMKTVIVRPCNMYGPRDNFSEEKVHVIPNLLRKIMKGDGTLTVFGTGTPTRSFLYVDDFCDAALLAIEKATDAEPLNIGTDEEISIKELVILICMLTGKNPDIIFDATKPDGYPRRATDGRKAKEKIGFVPKTSLQEGLKKTIQWYTEEVLHE